MTFAVTPAGGFNPVTPTEPSRNIQFQRGDENVGVRNIDTVDFRDFGTLGGTLHVRIGAGEQVNVLSVDREDPVLPPEVLEWSTERSSPNATISEDGLTAEAATPLEGGWVNVIATGAGKTTGKFYFEFEIVTVAGFNDRRPAFGVVTNAYWDNGVVSPPLLEIGTDQWGFRPNGAKAATGSDEPVFFEPYLADGDIAGIAVDLDAGKLWVSRNGVFDGDPAAGTGAAYTDLRTKEPYPLAEDNPAYPSASVGENDSLGKLTVRFAADSWSYAAPAGFVEWEI